MGQSANWREDKSYTEYAHTSDMNTALRPSSSISPPTKWSIYAGLYMFMCSTVTAFILYDILALLADVIGLPVPYSMVILASPAFVIGTVVWWAVVERRGSYTYLLGGTFGLLTALFTGILWTVRFVSFWGFEMLVVPVVSFLVVFVLGVAVVVGVLTGLPLMYVRRRLASGLERPL